MLSGARGGRSVRLVLYRRRRRRRLVCRFFLRQLPFLVWRLIRSLCPGRCYLVWRKSTEMVRTRLRTCARAYVGVPSSPPRRPEPRCSRPSSRHGGEALRPGRPVAIGGIDAQVVRRGILLAAGGSRQLNDIRGRRVRNVSVNSMGDMSRPGQALQDGHHRDAALPLHLRVRIRVWALAWKIRTIRCAAHRTPRNVKLARYEEVYCFRERRSLRRQPPGRRRRRPTPLRAHGPSPRLQTATPRNQTNTTRTGLRRNV
ncbi:hypothetical protein BD413DRAFT_538230 [Trametes elegans]|nr:hypothetical protein BD413DRAFT_538230 [Trametes elegans]